MTVFSPRSREVRVSTRADRGRLACVIALAGVVVLTSLVIAPSAAEAQRKTFDKPTVLLQATPAMNFLTGPLGEDAGAGLSFEFAQTLQYRYIGYNFSIGFAYFVTKQDPPPVTTGLEAYLLRTGPRLIFPYRAFRFVGEVEYVRFGVISNALVRQTGTELNFNGAGAGGQIQWILSRGLVGVRAGYTQFLDLDGGMITLSLVGGLVGSL